MKKLTSENVVRLLDCCASEDKYYIIVEYCNGGNLRNEMKTKKIIPEPEAVNILVDVLKGFLDLIKNGIVHRDVKPENILIHDGKFKLADFGFAMVVHDFSK